MTSTEQPGRRAFSVAEALAQGATRSRLRRVDLHKPHHGVRVATPASSVTEHVDDVVPLLRGGMHVSHMTAAHLWGLPLPPAFAASTTVHVTVTSGRGIRRQGIVCHRYAVTDSTNLGRYSVATPLECLIQCAEYLDLDALVVMGDALLGRWSSHRQAREVPLDLLARAVETAGGRRGSHRLRRAFALMRVGSWSPQETSLRLVLLRGGVDEEPELNVKVFHGGRYLGRGDLVFGRAKLVVEYEGDGHRVDPETWARDVRRRERFEDAGWSVLRVTKTDLEQHAPELVARVKGRLATKETQKWSRFAG